MKNKIIFTVLFSLTFSFGFTVSAYNFGDITLKNGSRGEAVMELQRFLNDNLNLGLKIDGKLGPKTIAVIKKWQIDNGLTPDGLIGTKTKIKMNSTLSNIKETKQITQIEPNKNLNGKMIINGKEIILPKQECSTGGTEGGPVKYILHVNFIDEKKENNFNQVTFSVQDSQNKESNLLKEGVHTSTGQHWDSYSNYLTENTYTFGMQPEDMDIVLEKVDVDKNIDRKFSAEGYVNIKRTIKKDCPEQVWVGGRYAKKGEPGYLCGYENQYLDAQKIYFKCDNYSQFDYTIKEEVKTPDTIIKSILEEASTLSNNYYYNNNYNGICNGKVGETLNSPNNISEILQRATKESGGGKTVVKNFVDFNYKSQKAICNESNKAWAAIIALPNSKGLGLCVDYHGYIEEVNSLGANQCGCKPYPIHSANGVEMEPTALCRK